MDPDEEDDWLSRRESGVEDASLDEEAFEVDAFELLTESVGSDRLRFVDEAVEVAVAEEVDGVGVRVAVEEAAADRTGFGFGRNFFGLGAAAAAAAARAEADGVGTPLASFFSARPALRSSLRPIGR